MRKEDLIGICSTSSRTVHTDDMCGDVLNTVGYGIRDILVLRSYCGTRLRLAEGAARGGNATRLPVGRSVGLCLPSSELGSARDATWTSLTKDGFQPLGALPALLCRCVVPTPALQPAPKSTRRGNAYLRCIVASMRAATSCSPWRAKGPPNRLASREASKISGPRPLLLGVCRFFAPISRT
jgi:hypothetical protein